MRALPLLEERIGYHFQKPALLMRAVTHRSFSADHYERLEFLGDSVLGCVIGLELFRTDQHFSEGRLSRVRSNLVREETLDEIASDLEIGTFLRLGEGELRTGGAQRASILADAVEAVIGAVFLDGGFEQAQSLVLRLYRKILSELPKRMGKDAKTELQELLQKDHLPLPQYRVVSCEGQPNDQHFVCECVVEHYALRTIGAGGSRKAAEQNAAAAALKRLQAKQAPVSPKAEPEPAEAGKQADRRRIAGQAALRKLRSEAKREATERIAGEGTVFGKLLQITKAGSAEKFSPESLGGILTPEEIEGLKRRHLVSGRGNGLALPEMKAKWGIEDATSFLRRAFAFRQEMDEQIKAETDRIMRERYTGPAAGEHAAKCVNTCEKGD